MSTQCNLILAKKSDFPKVYEIMHAAFPLNERRSYEGQRELLNHNNYKLFLHKHQERIIAFLAVWEFDEINFIEHFAVETASRGSGQGENMLKEYLSHAVNPVFLEVEPPSTEIARRRIKFYERIGFHLNKFDYLQPSLQEGQKPLLLKNMTYPNPLEEEFFDYCKKIIFETVYGLNFDNKEAITNVLL
ncbi:GNAT family N-acetyltransferase [Anaerocolumna aminovalerica]|uniref:GNAT family N-acetyltransferase n=1 Tax=Anaerocolumna aminovalerica TaxID=1527 RepID=UPI00248D168A|nr:GNAT family N-acetyltransferase [Anaerocolumna aminovalerica]